MISNNQILVVLLLLTLSIAQNQNNLQIDRKPPRLGGFT